MNFPIELTVIKFDINTWIAGIYMSALLISYWLIFRKHHKRNHVELFELVNLVTKYCVITTISLLLIIFGIDCIFKAHEFIETRSDVIAGVVLGILIISGTILYYIGYIKESLKDYDNEVREVNNKRTIKIGEILILICLIIVILLPVWRIPHYFDIFEDKEELITDLVKSFLLSFAAMFVLYNVNPLDFKSYLSKNFSVEKVDETKDIKEEVIDKKEDKEVKEETKIKKDTKKSTTKTNKKISSNNKKNNTSKTKKSTNKKQN